MKTERKRKEIGIISRNDRENDRKRPKMTEKTGRLVVLRRMNSSIFPQNSTQIP